MKPIVLSITAFGPYAGVEKVDFRRMGERSFFLINGPTGAGKTTILDAMCFALFGRTSGEIREGKAMRSDYVDPAVTTEVVFDFSLGLECYRVRRVPEQEVLKKRGVGTTKLSPSATLWQRTGLVNDQDEGKVLANDWRRVTDAAESLLGFKYEQFRQVVMLPQGDFRKLLLAGSKDRENILATLFQTELYRRVEEYFKLSAKELAEQVKELNAKREWTLEEAQAASVSDIVERLASEREKSVELTAKNNAARQALITARDTLTFSQRLKAEFDDLKQVEKTLVDLQAKNELMTVKRQQLEQAKRAAFLAETAAHIYQRQNEIVETKQKLVALSQALVKAEETEKQAREQYQAEELLVTDREDAVLLVTRLMEYETKLTELNEARKVFVQADRLACQADKAWGECHTFFTKLTAEVEKQKIEREQLYAEAAQVAALEAAWRESNNKAKYRQELDDLRRRYEIEKQSHAELQQSFEAKAQGVTIAKNDLEAAQMAWRLGQAAELAAGLTDGQPCPVCGAECHPHPAEKAATSHSNAALELAQDKLKQTEKELETLRRPLNDSKIVLESILIEGKKIRELVGSDLDKEASKLSAETQNIQGQLKAAQAAGTLLSKLEQELERKKEQLKVLEKELVTLEQNSRKNQATLDAAKAVRDERAASVPEKFQQDGQLKKELTAAISKREQLADNLRVCQKAAQASAIDLERAKTAVVTGNEALSSLLNRLEKEQTDFLCRINEAGFKSETEFSDALKPPAQIESLENQLKDYEEKLILANDRHKRLSEKVKDLLEPDIVTATAAVKEAEAIVEAINGDIVRLETLIVKAEEWLSQLKNQEELLGSMEGKYAVLGHLAEVANGQNALRISFHRFVLAVLFDDCLLAANARLRKMSRGRYRLKRMADVIHRGSAGGLDIEIEDSYTGVSRHVSTLSGGETFLASLSLALGLADVVQSYSGGIHLDTIFVDEGFGTLDPESLEMALQALTELQRRGRLVGIISHVPELKERIEARLEIVPTECGSTTRWVGLD
ncbi:MAG: ATPase involved in repair [Firmicutes bacterium]|nr:ATPase involved in repair [Bacillota bacterium]